MTTTFTRTNRYPQDPAQVRAMVTDASFQEQVCAQQNAQRYAVEVAAPGSSGAHCDSPVTVTITQTQSLAKAPDFAKKFAGDGVEIVHTETWRDATTAELVIAITGKPGTLRGSIVLRPAPGGGTEEVYDARVKVAIPLIGGKLESLIAGVLAGGLKRREQVGATWSP